VLLRLLKSLGGERSARNAAASPLATFEKLHAAHSGAPRELHLQILFGDLRIGDTALVDLVERCMRESFCNTPVLKWFHRPLASYFLARYFLHAMPIDGERAECGVFQGTSALILCRTARTREPAYAGERLHLFDSFAGLSAPGANDVLHEPGSDTGPPPVPAGTFAASIELVRESLREFPRTELHQGWVPEVFAGMPERRWSFVHLDLDLYAPTYGSLEYFYPRLAPGGVLICDDYGAPMFPGAHRAWDRYCEENGIPYIALDTGQSVIVKA